MTSPFTTGARLRTIHLLLACIAGGSLHGCWDDSPDGVPAPPAATPGPAPAPASFSVGGGVSGLTAPGLVLANGTDSVVVASGASGFTLPTAVDQGAGYAVVVRTQPAGEQCSVGNATGTIVGANVTNVAVTCAVLAHALGGSISGLPSSGLVLSNGADTLSPAAGALTFAFPTPVAELPHLDRAVATFTRAGQLDSRDGLSALFHRGNVRLESGQFDAARVDLERCLQLGQAHDGPSHRFAVATREKLAFLELQLGHYERSLQIAREGLALPVGEDPAWDALRRLRLRSVLGQTLTTMERYPEAEATFAQLLADAPKVPAFSVADVMVARLQLARNYHYDGNEEEALRQTRVLVPDMERVLGPHHFITRVGRQVMCQALTVLGRYDEAIAVQQANLDGAVGADGQAAAAVEQGSLAIAYRKAGRFDEARGPAAQALKILEAANTEPKRREVARRTVGEAELGLGHVDAGTRLIETVRDNGQRIKGYAGSSDEAATLESLAVAHRLAGDWDGAQALLDQACQVYRHSNRAESAVVRRCEVQRQWVQAMRAPDSDAARQAFADAAASYVALLPTEHVGRVDLVLMQADLDARAHRGTSLDRRATLDAWQRVVGRPWPGHLVFIH